jgi:drug/metabolite transporter (DMT)-like permease
MSLRTPSALASLGAVIVIWAAAPIVLKYFAGVLDAWTVNGLRYFFTALFWLPVVYRQRALVRDPALWRAAALPAFCHLLGQAGWGLAPYYNDASVMNFVSRLGFLFTALAGFLLLRSERALVRRPMFWVGAAGSIAGLIAMFRGGTHTGGTSPLGMGILVWTSACWSLYAVNVRLRMARYPARLAFGVVSLMVVPGMLVLMFSLGDWRAATELSGVQWMLLIGSAWLGIALGHVLYYQSVHALGPILSEGSLAVIPFLTALLAHLILGEHMILAQWIGGSLLVLATLFLLSARK